MNYDGTKCYFHVDLDAFFASVEQLEHPEWRGKPVVVGGVPGDRRAVVSTASYEARKFGVHSAMPLVRAVELCPNAIYVRGNHKLYSEYSEKIMAIFGNYSPDVKQISIDEAFLDLTGTGRLFGDPIQTARRLKAEVFEKTGLTVSVGIATSNYIAKIASDLQKPNGLYAVLPGEEENFMLNLPLEKVWGIGQKTLARLKEAGFNSTHDIYNHSQKLLASIFGESQATFLYNVVRGIDPPGFLEEAKTHSAGIETTYDYDLTEWDAIEGALLDLSEHLMFRLLRHNITGKTLVVKIRYEDFTTVSVRETSGQNITSVDDLFSRAKKIFRKKYEAGRGIRLLGITVGNTQNADSEAQNELFDFGENKRRALEKSILKLEQKNPEIKIHKARLLSKDGGNSKDSKKARDLRQQKLRSIIALVVASTLLFFQQNAFCDEINKIDASGSGTMVIGKDLPPENQPQGATLFDLNIKDKHIKFDAFGWWNAKFTQTTTMTYGFGNDFTVSADVPIFKQEVDLSLDFMLNDHWFFQAAFADEFETNTIAMGYTNGTGYLRDARISNRYITFPTTYSVDDVGRGIGGGKNQAPGISANFADPNGKWTLDTAARYDMLEQFDKTYYGKNSVNDNDRAKSSFLTGRMFVLPSYQSAAAVTGVYVETYGGSYTDTSGKKYKKLSTSDYIVVPSRKMILLSNEAGASKKNSVLPAVAVTFGAGGIAQLKSELGKYGTATAQGTGFLGDVQKEFGAELKNVPNIASFSYGGKSRGVSVPDSSGEKTEGFFGTIAGEEVLYVQHPAGFSPFTVAFRYDFGTSKIDEIAVVNSQSGKAAEKYAAIQADDDLSITEENYFKTSIFYADVYDTVITSNDYANPVIRFPFCRTSPGTYLGYGENDDMVLRARNYTPVNRFDIGTNAVSGTVRVYKNAVLDSGAKYNPESGEVTLSSAVSATDKIYIVWSEDSESFESGAIAAAVGFNYNFTEKLSGDVSAATRWTIAPYMDFADSASAASGYATLASRIKFSNENLTVANTISGTVENTNTTGYYRIFGMDDVASTTSYLASGAGKSLPSNFAPRLNTRPSDFSGTAKELAEEYGRTLGAKDGSDDKEITGYKIPLSFNFAGDAEEWAARTIAISGSSLSSASTFTFALKTEEDFSGLDVYLQLGVNTEENFSSENKGSIPTWKISRNDDGTLPDDVRSAFNPDVTGWQQVSVVFKDVDRANCTNYTGARLVVVNSGGAALSRTIYFGPYEISSQGIFTLQDEAFTITSAQIRSANSAASKLNKKTNYAQEISWSAQETSVPSDTQITMYKYFEESDAADYSEINMLFKYSFDGASIPNSNDESALIFLLDTESKEVSGEGKIAARAELSHNALKNYGDNQWHCLTINTDKNRVKIDGTEISKTDCKVRINRSVVPSRAKIVFNTSSADAWYKSGTFCIDEIYFSETSVHFVLEDKNSVNYKMPNSVVVGNDYELLKNLEVRASSKESLTLYTQEERSAKGDVSADGGVKFTFAGINFSADVARAADSKSVISNAGHSISTETPILNVIDFSEEYNFDTENKSAAKINSAKLDFSSLKVPIVLSGRVKSDSSEWSLSSESSTALDFSFEKNKVRYTLNIGANAAQKTLPSTNGAEIIGTENYFVAWLDSTKNEFEFGNPLASKRKVGAEIKNTLNLPWASLAPQLNFYSEENYTVAKNVYYSDKSAFDFILPFKLKHNTLSFSWKKTSGGVNATEKGGDYSNDIRSLCDTLGGRGYFFATPIFYDLFSSNLQDKVSQNTSRTKENAEQQESEYYTGEYAINFSRPTFSNKYDIFVPASASLSVARDIRAAETLSDTYQAKLRLNWKAFNIFGSDGVKPIAKWFKQDEYISSFIATLKIPRENPEQITQVYTTYIQANFYISDDNVLKNGFQFEFQDKENFNTKFTVLWRRPGKTTPFLALAKAMAPKLKSKTVPITRNDSLNCQWKRSVSGETERRYQSYEFSHSVDYKIGKYISLSTGVDLGWSCMWDDICTITATWTLGGKLLF